MEQSSHVAPNTFINRGSSTTRILRRQSALGQVETGILICTYSPRTQWSRTVGRSAICMNLATRAVCSNYAKKAEERPRGGRKETDSGINLFDPLTHILRNHAQNSMRMQTSQSLLLNRPSRCLDSIPFNKSGMVGPTHAPSFLDQLKQ